MTKEEFRDRMQKIFESKDKEWRHAEADDLMCELLESLGYEEGTSVFRKADKWYA